MPKTALFLFVLLLASCQSSPDQKAENPAKEKPSKEQPASSVVKAKGPLLYTTQRSHKFSSQDQLDYFRVELRGESVTKGTVFFTITTRDGTIIHSESFPAAALEAAMVYEMTTPTATKAERENYILQRLKTFVEPQDFISPAIASSARPDTSFVTLTTWQNIQAQPNTIGFKYLLGKEDGHLLVYDPEQKKAVRYGGFGG